MKTCNDYQQQISAYHDGELSKSQVEQLLGHIETCDSCRSALVQAKTLSSLLQNVTPLATLPVTEYYLTPCMAAVRRGAVIRLTSKFAAAAACIIVSCSAWLAVIEPSTDPLPNNWERLAMLRDQATPTESFTTPSSDIELAMLMIDNTYNQENSTDE